MEVCNLKKVTTSNHLLPILITILLLINSCIQPTSASPKPHKRTQTSFLKSCSKTTYKILCSKTLSPYASYVKTNALRLSNTALSVAIKTTASCSASVSKLAKQKGITRLEGLAIRECIGNMKDTAYELKRTVTAMAHLRGRDRKFQWSNAKTYASAAITNAETCVDGFMERKVNPVVRQKVRSCVARVEQHISNALALINHLY